MSLQSFYCEILEERVNDKFIPILEKLEALNKRIQALEALNWSYDKRRNKNE